MTPTAERKPNGLVNFAMDFGPLLAFFITYKVAERSTGSLIATITGTGVFMAAVLIAMATSLYLYRRVSPMMWLSAVLVIGFGGLTIYFRDPAFIQLKPTLIYVAFGIVLFGGLMTGRPLLKYVFGPAFPGLSERGWLLISRNWACFFVVMAIANEVLRYNVTFETWLFVKVWGFTVAALLFGFANIPLLLRHGMTFETAAEEPPIPPS